MILLSLILTCVGCFNNMLFEKQEFIVSSIELQTKNITEPTSTKYLINLKCVTDPIVSIKYYTNEEFKVGDTIIFSPEIKN